MSRSYCVYGVPIRSTGEIPGLLPEITAPETSVPGLSVHWGKSPTRAVGPWRPIHIRDSDEADDSNVTIERSEGFVRMIYRDGTVFWFTAETTELWATWEPPYTPEDASTYLLGPVLGYILRIRGVLALHASAVVIEGRAVAFAGPPWSGKSTTAAALVRKGFPLLSEDVCALREEDGRFQVIPGYPLIRLWPSSVEVLYGQADALPPLTPNWDKRQLALTPRRTGGTDASEAGFRLTPAPLAAVFLMERGAENGDAARISVTPPARALLQLSGNTYKNLLLDPGQREEEFVGLQRLVEGTPVFTLTSPPEGAPVDSLCDLIVETTCTT